MCSFPPRAGSRLVLGRRSVARLPSVRPYATGTQQSATAATGDAALSWFPVASLLFMLHPGSRCYREHYTEYIFVMSIPSIPVCFATGVVAGCCVRGSVRRCANGKHPTLRVIATGNRTSALPWMGLVSVTVPGGLVRALRTSGSDAAVHGVPEQTHTVEASASGTPSSEGVD